MMKLAIVFAAALGLVQIAVGSPLEKRDVGVQIPAAEVTTESLFSSLQKGVGNVFSTDTVDKAKKALGDFGNKVKEGGSTILTNVKEGGSNLFTNVKDGGSNLLSTINNNAQNLMKKTENAAPTATAEAPAKIAAAS